MPIEYKVIKNDHYLLVKVDATTDSPDDLAEYIDNVLIDCNKHDATKVLLDNRKLIFNRQFAGTYELAVKCIDKISADRPMKIALVARPERMEFARAYETIGLSQGIAIKAFDEKKLASAWLKA